jgi:cytoskeleton protein RodZ
MEEDAVLLDQKDQELDLNFHTDMPVGEILRRTRKHYGQTLQQVEVVLRIRASQLEALETGDHSQLPGRVYALGFVRSYSEYLGLDGDKMVHLFKQQFGGKQKKPDLSFPVAASESKTPNWFVIGGSVFGVLVLVGFISFLMFPKGEKAEIPPVPDTLTKSQLNEAPALVGQAGPVPAVEQPGVAAPAATADAPVVEAPKNTNRIVLEITDATWVEIRNAAGEAILRQVLKPGDIYLVPNEKGLIMATGNAGGIKVKVDGKDLASLGETGQIRRKIPLDADALLKSLAKN